MAAAIPPTTAAPMSQPPTCLQRGGSRKLLSSVADPPATDLFTSVVVDDVRATRIPRTNEIAWYDFSGTSDRLKTAAPIHVNGRIEGLNHRGFSSRGNKHG
jgi:hypothetical protein